MDGEILSDLVSSESLEQALSNQRKHATRKHRAFVISLERATERLAHARALLAQLPMPAEILPAVDGSALSPAERDAVFQRGLHQPHYPFVLGAGEIGCFLSHRKAWQAIVDQDLDAGLILEDDVSIDVEQLRSAFDFVAEHAPQEAYVQFPVRSLPSSAQRLVASPRCRLVRLRVTPLRTSGQWVSRAVAEKLLAATRTFDRPIDTTLQMHWRTGVPMLALEPSGLSDKTAELGGSTISIAKRRRFTLEKLAREVSRACYRWRIARLSARASG